eukprot:CAMPEP_0201909576 /NCGR_PEP_ID=MMETSP0903-20130614/1290_1 /ASSEMBLY_ACC=CAM_ASM_000552 /TAXON_ID=420261 /ORGANISM="Thalassiosira antarctica, Strain CCMP982" /LENGTH=63 /DNA_ID=CAMNT_0048444115 /DNA_START=436 /DNA_END=627 /DNA_ORIENTATION=+
MSANASDEIDPRAAAAAVEASATSAGATTTAIAGNTMAVIDYYKDSKVVRCYAHGGVCDSDEE